MTVTVPAGSPPRIRAVARHELGALQELERAAGRRFADLGMPEIADEPPLPVPELDRYRRAGSAWVSVDALERPVAYLVAERLDDALHIEQVSVHPSWGRRGLGHGLLRHAAGHAAALGLSRLTLVTFEQVPWNAPYYRRCGFSDLAEADWTPGLRAVRAQEQSRGLDRWPRVCLGRSVLDPT